MCKLSVLLQLEDIFSLRGSLGLLLRGCGRRVLTYGLELRRLSVRTHLSLTFSLHFAVLTSQRKSVKSFSSPAQQRIKFQIPSLTSCFPHNKSSCVVVGLGSINHPRLFLKFEETHNNLKFKKITKYKRNHL